MASRLEVTDCGVQAPRSETADSAKAGRHHAEAEVSGLASGAGRRGRDTWYGLPASELTCRTGKGDRNRPFGLMCYAAKCKKGDQA